MADDGGETLVRETIGLNEFTFQNEKYKIIKNAKPKPDRENIPTRPSAIETKTDFYLLAKKIKDGIEKEFKISYKKPSFSFVENKVKTHRIPFIYGEKWSQILKEQSTSIQELFNTEGIVNFQKETIKLGWRYEIEQIDAPGFGPRHLSVNISQNISSQVLWGDGCAKGMRDAFVDNEIIENSGIPDHILIKDPSKIKNINDVFQDLQNIRQYAKNHPSMQASYVAQNNRWKKDLDKWKTEGFSRGFPVWISWKVDNNDMLQGKPVFDRPYEQDSGNIIETLKECFVKLGIPYQGDFKFEMLKGRFSEDTVVN